MPSTLALANRRGIAQKALAAARDERHRSTAVLLLTMLAAGALAFWLTRGLTFYNDEWRFIGHRQANDLDTLLRPQGEHIVLLHLLVFKGLFYVVGLAHYWPYRVAVIGLHLVCAALLFLVARRRVGDALAVVPAAVLLFLGPAWEAILWPFEISFLIPVACGLGIMLLLERGDLKGDLIASVLLLLAFASGSISVPVAAGASVYILLGRARWRRLLRVVAAPTALYGLWLLEYREQQVVWDRVSGAPKFVADASGSNLASIVSLPNSWGWVLALGLALAVVVRLVRDPRGSRWLLAVLVMALAYWGLTALFRPWYLPPFSRYLYAGSVFLMLIVIELMRGVRVPRGGVAVAYALAAAVVVSNIGELKDGANLLRRYSDFMRPGLGALELAKGRVDPQFEPMPLQANWIVAGQYFKAVEKFGSPAAPPDQIVKRGEDVRRASDAVLQNALRLGLVPARLPPKPGPLPAVTRTERGTARALGGCVRFLPSAGPGSVELRLTTPGVALRAAGGAGATLRLRRFAQGYGPNDVAPGQVRFPELEPWAQLLGFGMHKPVVLELPGARAHALRIPADRADQPWHMRIASSQPVVTCALPPSAA